SLPCMFSALGKSDYEDRDGPQEGLLDVLQRAGLAVLWIDNQSGCKGVCDRVPTVNTRDLNNPAFCPNGECFDAVMLDGLDERIAQLPAAQRDKGVVVVLHQMGSHGPAYFKRAPEAYKAFKPECTSNALQSCDRQAVVNAYDNSIRYTDHVLAASIQWLSRQPDHDTAMWYVSDHGESLGENNLYLHGLPYSLAPVEQKHVPQVSWFSRAMQQRLRLDTTCLAAQADVPLTHDGLFHTLLALADVKTALYQASLDVTAACRQTN
ncbi:MAG: phosphoethanolamine transferase, partial [Burkholderiaceae bacterium]